MDINSTDYLVFLAQIKLQIRQAQIKLARSATGIVSDLYWSMGQKIVEKQKEQGWGESIVEQISRDLKRDFPDATFGFSPRNLWDMRRLYLEYKDHPKLRQLVAVIPWGQNLLIINKLKTAAEREYYLKGTQQYGWTRSVLQLQIKSDAYHRHVAVDKQHNFKDALIPALAQQADEAMKDVYMLDLAIGGKIAYEAELESQMVTKIEKVLLELGYGFCFIGRQYRLVNNNTEYFIDLLFFNRPLKSLFAVELKAGRFKAEYAGKMNLYLNLLDELVKQPDENPSIGLILCAERDRVEVEYTLRGINKPIGVAEYQLTRDLPKILQDKLPDPRLIEEQIRHQLLMDKDEEGDNQNGPISQVLAEDRVLEK